MSLATAKKDLERPLLRLLVASDRRLDGNTKAVGRQTANQSSHFSGWRHQVFVGPLLFCHETILRTLFVLELEGDDSSPRRFTFKGFAFVVFILCDLPSFVFAHALMRVRLGINQRGVISPKEPAQLIQVLLRNCRYYRPNHTRKGKRLSLSSSLVVFLVVLSD
jgi:hypothetical protein